MCLFSVEKVTDQGHRASKTLGIVVHLTCIIFTCELLTGQLQTRPNPSAVGG